MIEKIKQIVKRSSLLTKLFRAIIGDKKINTEVPYTTKNGTKNIFNIDKTAVLFNCMFDIIGDNNEIEISESCLINNVTFFIRGDNNKIKIGKAVRFNKGGSIWIEDYNCEAIIGDNTTFEDSHIAVTEPNSKIQIGNDCMFANDIDIRTGDSHSIIDSLTNER